MIDDAEDDNCVCLVTLIVARMQNNVNKLVLRNSNHKAVIQRK